MEDTGQILDQLAEVHPPIGGKVEHDLGAVEGVLGFHQFHFQPVACDAFLTGAVGALFVLAVLLHAADVHAVCHAGDGLESLGHRRICDLTHALHHLAALDTARRLDDDILTGLDVGICGVKKITFSVFFKTDRDDFFHIVPRFIVRSMG